MENFKSHNSESIELHKTLFEAHLNEHMEKDTSILTKNDIINAKLYLNFRRGTAGYMRPELTKVIMVNFIIQVKVSKFQIITQNLI